MSMKKEDYLEFERQLELQNQTDKVKTKTDEDGTEYEWDEVKKAFFPKVSADMIWKFQETYKSAESSASVATEEGKKKTDSYYDPLTKIMYVWDHVQNTWARAHEHRDAASGALYRYYNDMWNLVEKGTTKTPVATGNTYTDTSTGKVYTWNTEKSLWMAEDGSFLYPSVPSEEVTDKEECSKEGDGKKDNKKKRKNKGPMSIGGKKSKAEWFSKDNNNSVYVEGLPPDYTLEEFTKTMQKCGIIQTNPHTNSLKVKLYMDPEGNPKGDGLCTYLKRESVELAMKILHESTIKTNYVMKIQNARFEMKGNFDASLKPKMLSKLEKKKIQKQLDKQLDWKLGSAEQKLSKSDRVVILKNMFKTYEFEEDAVLIIKIKEFLEKECAKYGDVKKVIVFDRHPDGVCSVAFKEITCAKDCVDALNGRLLRSRKVEASVWDGTTDYQVEETAREREERLKNWNDYLEKDPDKDLEKDNENSPVKEAEKNPEKTPIKDTKKVADKDAEKDLEKI